MIYNRKTEILFDEETQRILDDQSKKCNWLYNKLLDTAREDYRNGNTLKLMSGRNLRNYAVKLKADYPFLYSVHSSPLKNVAIRLKESYDRFLKGLSEMPHFRSYSRKWFSLYYDEPRKGFQLQEKKEIDISLGKIKVEETDQKGNTKEKEKQLHIKGKLKETLRYGKHGRIKTFRLCKEKNRFYGIFTIEEPDKEVKTTETKRWISIDQNHKNFFVGVDYKGETYEFERFYADTYFDKKIDFVKSKRDRCLRKAKKQVTEYGNTYYIPSKRYQRLDLAVQRLYARRREQMKSGMYQIAHFLCKNYDEIIIGNYVPGKETAKSGTMRRSMLNQSHIGEFRKILKWVSEKSGKVCKIVDEKDTTKKCCVCGDMEKKTPQIREFVCKKCSHKILRDVNSAVNIAVKGNLEVNIKDMTLDKIVHIGKINRKTENKINYKLQVI